MLRTFHRPLKRSLSALTLSGLVVASIWPGLLPTPRAQANGTIFVTTTDDEFNVDGDCSLREAIVAANTDTAVDACSAGSGSDIVVLEKQVYRVGTPDNYWYGPNGLPPIASDITILGEGAVLEVPPGTTRLRFFFVGADPDAEATKDYSTPGAGKLELRELTLRGGRQQGGDSGGGGGGAGMGGAIFNQGSLTLNRVTLTDNVATGGSSGVAGLGGGGGGLGQDAQGDNGGGFGGPVRPINGASTGSALGGGGGFRTQDSATSNNGGGPRTGLGASTSGGLSGNGSGAGGSLLSSTGAHGRGGDFGLGGDGSGRDVDAGGGGGIGGGGGSGKDPINAGGGGGGGFGGGGGGNGGDGGFAGGDSGSGGVGLGGAIFNHNGRLNLNNSTLSGNAAIGGRSTTSENAEGYGGALFNLNGTVDIMHSTLANNSVSAGISPNALPDENVAKGSDIFHEALDTATARVAELTLKNSILASLSGSEALRIVQAKTVAGKANLAIPQLGTRGKNLVHSMRVVGDIDIDTDDPTPLSDDPLLGPLQGNGGSSPTMKPGPGSPAIDALPAASCTPGEDQRERERFIDGDGDGRALCDIGAVEVQPGLAAITVDVAGQLGGAPAFGYQLFQRTGLFLTPIASFELDGDAASAIQQSQRLDKLELGTYIVQQQPVSGWQLDEIVCNTPADTTVTPDVAAGRVIIQTARATRATEVKCAFTNVLQPNPGAIKVQVGGSISNGPAFNFQLLNTTGTLVEAFALDDNPDPTYDESQRFTGLALGSYTVQQKGTSGWQLDEIECDNASVTIDLPARRATITLSSAVMEVNCTFRNNRSVLPSPTTPTAAPTTPVPTTPVPTTAVPTNPPVPTTPVPTTAVPTTAVPTNPPVPTTPVAIRINAGGPAVTVNGISWLADQFYRGGDTFTPPSIATPLYRDLRQSPSGPPRDLNYAIPVPAGSYLVRLHFIEHHWGVTKQTSNIFNKRVISARIENQTLLKHYDVNAEAPPRTPVVKSFSVNVTDGTLNLRLRPHEDRVALAALEVLSPELGAAPVGTLRVATSAQSNKSEELAGRTIKNTVQVRLPAVPQGGQARWWLNDTARQRAPRWVGQAVVLNTKQLPNGLHTLTVEVLDSQARPTLVYATFRVKN